MPRFSVAFTKRKSAADDLEHVPVTAPEQPSFHVIERHEVASGRSFDGGARLARALRSAAPKQASASASDKSTTTTTANSHLLDLRAEDNMFADLKANHGSGVSNTTNATSTDNSSRHSNASTAPSSTDLGGAAGPDDARQQAKQPQEPPWLGGSKSSFLDRATRTFSFGGQKKHMIPPPKESHVPDLPPVLTLQAAAASESRSRGMTASTASTATPTKPDGPSFDLGGDFGSLFSSTAFDKRASMATLRLDGIVEPRSLTAVRRVVPAAPQSPDTATPAEPLSGRRNNSPGRGDASPSAYHDALPPHAVLRHQTPGSFKRASRSSDIVEDEDAKLLRESFTAMRMLSSEKSSRAQAHRYRRDEDSFMANPAASALSNDDNMFEGSMSRFPRAVHRHMARAPKPPQSNNKVMTPAEFEQYRQDKERQGSTEQAADATANSNSNNHDGDEDDEINYDDDDDELEKSKQQVKQRRKQEAHMAVYRQQMMKVTGEPASTPLPRNNSSRSGLLSLSAPQLSLMQLPSPDAAAAVPPTAAVADDEDEDEDVPLGILQAHGFPGKNRPPTRLGRAGSSSNLRASMLGPPAGRPASVSGETPPSNVAARRQSTLPAFARNLPQDPFVGASIARPAVRESLSFGDAGQLGQTQGALPPGGLVGVIANGERTRALRRGSPTIDSHRLGAAALGGPLGGPGFDPVAGIPHMYSGNTAAGMPGMAHMAPSAPQMLTPGDQVQIQMSQQMQQFMQMQMHFMQMVANRTGGGLPMQPPMQPPMHPPYGAGFPSSASAANLSSRHSLVGKPPVMESRRMDHSMRTMSMVQPSSSSMMSPHHGAPSIRGSFAGYAPSIAPSERSNIGLPGRYRPVSQAPPPPAHGHVRASTMSGGLSDWDDDKRKSMVQLVSKAGDGSDDDEQGWEAMRAKREKKRSLWRRGKKSFSSELAL